MPLESAIPNALTGDAASLACAQAQSTNMDSDAFAGFYERSARPLWAYLARTSGDPALADDLVQESFIRFLAADAPTDGEVASRRYLFRIGTNLLRDHWRRPRHSSIEEVPEEFCRAADASAQSDSLMTLGPALSQLRPRARQLIWLAYAEGYSHSEIAAITGLASASIRLLLFRARRQMARLLQADRKVQVPQDQAQNQTDRRPL
jgi:RNA polymerase sigma-70 factor (ECF subfamily)